MKISKFSICLFLVSMFFIVSCSSVPVTGRKQITLMPATSLLSMSLQQYDEFLNNNKLSNNSKDAELVKMVGLKIQTAVEEYLGGKGFSDKLKGYEWEFNLVEGPEVNAWAMPGGKVVVYTGILPITEDATGLAVVMGHEIAHAIAEHGRERMSQQLIAQLGSAALMRVARERPEKTKQMLSSAIGMGTQFGIMLPFSRLHESEADHMGLIFMAMAGYNPNSAVDFWQRMADLKEGNAPPEFMSTHPSDKTRIANIKEQIPEAMKYYGTAK